ncbi:hypothetical protein R1CP_40215 (plasmid) [Rhodococcus opacus]|uniref:Uncharacterized protein n=1 Tax=Rhodococcus opacus TaxID=37919 RepID=A0A1B1KJ46_RHOOP|nr:hypothetical protein R1CP_40215 [Rhodococcus opacus]
MRGGGIGVSLVIPERVSLLMLALPSTMAIAATPGLPALQVLQALPALLVLPMLQATRSLQALLSFLACRRTSNACNAFMQFRCGMPVLLSIPSLMVTLCRQQCLYCLQRWQTDATDRYGQPCMASSPCNSQFCQYSWQNCDSGYCQQRWRNARSLRATVWRPRSRIACNGDPAQQRHTVGRNPGSLIPESALARCVVPPLHRSIWWDGKP